MNKQSFFAKRECDRPPLAQLRRRKCGGRMGRRAVSTGFPGEKKNREGL